MAILGPFPDGGYELWCDGCGGKITCFSLSEIFDNENIGQIIEKFKSYDTFYCSDCLPILKDKPKAEFNKERLFQYLKEYNILNSKQ